MKTNGTLRCQCSAQSEARIFERGGHSVSKGGYSPDCHVNLHAVFLIKKKTVLKMLNF